MNCKNCQKSVPDGVKFCPFCGSAIDAAPVEAPVETPVEFTAPVEEAPAEFTAPETVGVVPELVTRDEIPAPSAKSKNGKKIALFGGIGAVIIAAIVLVFGWFNGNKADANGYINEVKSYLNYIANKDTDARRYLSDMYFGGNGFGSSYNGSEAAQMHEIYMRALFEEEKEDYSMGYGYGYEEYSTWEEYLKESTIEDYYSEFEYEYGENWKLTYKIGETQQIPADELDEFQEYWDENGYQEYEWICDEMDLSEADRKKMIDFASRISEMKVTDAYSVEVSVEIKGDDNSGDTTVEFLVAKIGNEWVIMEGPSIYDLIYLY